MKSYDHPANITQVGDMLNRPHTAVVIKTMWLDMDSGMAIAWRGHVNPGLIFAIAQATDDQEEAMQDEKVRDMRIDQLLKRSSPP